jgi:hypothetical protein
MSGTAGIPVLQGGEEVNVRMTDPHRASSGQSTVPAQPHVVGGWLAACRRQVGYAACWCGSGRMLMSAVEVFWDLLIFLALVAVGLVVLNLVARGR